MICVRIACLEIRKVRVGDVVCHGVDQRLTVLIHIDIAVLLIFLLPGEGNVQTVVSGKYETVAVLGIHQLQHGVRRDEERLPQRVAPGAGGIVDGAQNGIVCLVCKIRDVVEHLIGGAELIENRLGVVELVIGANERTAQLERLRRRGRVFGVGIEVTLRQDGVPRFRQL